MGHQCTSSAESYGNRRSGRKENITIKAGVSIEKIQRKVRVNHLTAKEIKE